MGAGGNDVVLGTFPLSRECGVGAYPSVKRVKEFGISTWRSRLLLPPRGKKGGIGRACRESRHRIISIAPLRDQAAPKIPEHLRLRPCLPPPSPQPTPPKGAEGAGCGDWNRSQKLQASPC